MTENGNEKKNEQLKTKKNSRQRNQTIKEEKTTKKATKRNSIIQHNN